MRAFFFSLAAVGVYFPLFLTGCAAKTSAPAKAGAAQRSVKNPAAQSASATHSAGPKNDTGEVEPFYESSGDKELNAPAVPAVEATPQEEVIGGEVEEEIAKSMRKDVPQFDIPIVMNAQVEKWMNYFQGKGRKYYTRYLSRSERYVPMMKKILRENGLPEDIIYLAMIESGFAPAAYPRAKASGPWQFIKGTGKLYGLRTSFWIDERRDPEKSTLAAAQHLKDLYDQFNSWPLAFASYNAGAGKISKAIRKYSTEDFWEMSKSKNRYLRAETKNYVPKMIAAALIAKSPEKYGFTEITYDEPFEYDKVMVPEPTEVAKIAEALGIDGQLLVDLNPELTKGITPPDMPNYELKIPKGNQEKFINAYPEIRKKSPTSVVKHVVHRSETLASISKKYGMDPEVLKTFNRLPPKRLRSGQQLAIPLYGDAVIKTAALTKFSPAEEEEPVEKGKKSTYKVRSGDTLWSISRRFGVSVSEIRRWNDLGSGRNIFPGQKVKLYARSDPTIIAPAPEVPVPAVQGPPASANAAGEWKTYQVQEGDSLWTISKQFGVKPSDISDWNSLSSDSIKPGQELKIKAVGL